MVFELPRYMTRVGFDSECDPVLCWVSSGLGCRGGWMSDTYKMSEWKGNKLSYARLGVRIEKLERG